MNLSTKVPVSWHVKFKILMVSLACFLLSACANLSMGNLFSHYSAQNKDIYQNVTVGNYQLAANELSDSDLGGPILSNMEKGRVFFLAQNYPLSFDALKLSDQATAELAKRATISLSETANQAGSLATNDNLTTYEPADYELSYLHLYLGLNYLQTNDLSGALVEMRRANQVQESARKIRQGQLQQTERSMQQNGIQPNVGSILSRYPDAGKSLQAVQNGYLLFLSAILYEAAGELNDAYIDYTRALTVNPENREIIDGTIRVAKRLGMKQDLQSLLKKYDEPALVINGQGQVIILDERGVVAEKNSWKLSLPIWDRSGKTRIYTVALPVYNNVRLQRFSPLKLDNQSLKPSMLVDTNLMAQNELSERIGAIVLKQGLRLYTKDRLRSHAAKADSSGVTDLLVNIWNITTEQPDTRSWQTLPAQVYSSSINLTSGNHTISAGGQLYTISVKANKRTLVWISRQGNSVTLWQKQLGAI